MTKEEAKRAEDILVGLMKKQPVKCIGWMLVQLGKEMNRSNAESMEIKQEMTLNNIRYKVECNIKIKKVKFIQKSLKP